MTMNTRAVLLAVTLAASLAAVDAARAADATPAATDVLDRPAQMSPLASKKLLQAVARAGDRLVAVGQRGHILTSTDGQTWTQAAVPVSSDLTAVFFVNDTSGWAVGHDGVILASTDGGLTWTRQLDGRGVNETLVRHLQARAAAEPQSKEIAALLAEAQRFAEQGPDKPFLDVWFENDKVGYVVGAYNLVMATTDGGKTWQPWFDRTDNPGLLNLYAIRPAAGGLYVAGEAGLVMKLDAAAGRFRAVPVDYKGSLFGVVDTGDAVLVFGLRGNVFRSDDGGRQWQKIDTGLPATVVSGLRTRNGNVVLADQGGRIAVSGDGGRTFSRLPLERPVPVTAIAEAGADRLVATGPLGVVPVAAPAKPR